jgi:hypothetical protein
VWALDHLSKTRFMCGEISRQFGLLKFSALSTVLLINKIKAQSNFFRLPKCYLDCEDYFWLQLWIVITLQNQELENRLAFIQG